MDRLPHLLAFAVVAVAGMELTAPRHVSATESPHSKTSGDTQLKLAARVNGQPILRDDILAAIRPVAAEFQGTPEAVKRTKELFDTVREQFIDRELLYQDAVAKLERYDPSFLKKLKKIQQAEFEKHLRDLKTEIRMTHEQFLDKLRKSGMTLEHLQRFEERKFFGDEYMRSRIYPIIQRETVEPRLAEYYERHANDFRRPGGGAGIIPFEEAKKSIARKLREQIAGREARRVIQELRSRATIEIVNDSSSDTQNQSAD
jgi:hypothetical protein